MKIVNKNDKFRKIIKKEFVEILDKYDVFYLFIDNLIKQNKDIIKCLSFATQFNDFCYFLNFSFCWDETPQGHAFWQKIYKNEYREKN